MVLISIEDSRFKIEDLRIRSDLIDFLELKHEASENNTDRIPQIFNFQSSIFNSGSSGQGKANGNWPSTNITIWRKWLHIRISLPATSWCPTIPGKTRLYLIQRHLRECWPFQWNRVQSDIPSGHLHFIPRKKISLFHLNLPIIPAAFW